MTRKSSILLLLAGIVLGSDVPAWAVVGRPLTPLSYAGVARRTTRRAVVATSAVRSVNTAAAVTVLPSGCARTVVGAATYQNCSGTYYQPSYSGPNVVYVPVPAPTG